MPGQWMQLSLILGEIGQQACGLRLILCIPLVRSDISCIMRLRYCTLCQSMQFRISEHMGLPKENLAWEHVEPRPIHYFDGLQPGSNVLQGMEGCLGPLCQY